MTSSIRHFSTVFIITLSASGLAGCQTINGITGSGGDAAPATSPEQSAPTPTPQAAAPAPASPNAGGLTGMDSARVLALWGEPTIRRKDIGSELWTYNKGNSKCSVLLYVYPAPDGGMSIVRAEASPGGASEDVVTACARTNELPTLKPVS